MVPLDSTEEEAEALSGVASDLLFLILLAAWWLRDAVALSCFSVPAWLSSPASIPRRNSFPLLSALVCFFLSDKRLSGSTLFLLGWPQEANGTGFRLLPDMLHDPERGLFPVGLMAQEGEIFFPSPPAISLLSFSPPFSSLPPVGSFAMFAKGFSLLSL